MGVIFVSLGLGIADKQEIDSACDSSGLRPVRYP